MGGEVWGIDALSCEHAWGIRVVGTPFPGLGGEGLGCRIVGTPYLGLGGEGLGA